MLLSEANKQVETGSRYKSYMLVVLLTIYAFVYMDRYAFGIVAQDIKTDLGLSDGQLGVLNGMAAAFFYALMSIPIARWADRGNRVRIIWVMALLQTLAIASIGFAGTFVQLLLLRFLVSIGEAGCVPPAHSLMADYFSRSERPRAVARYKLGSPLSYAVGFFGAGWLAQLFGWRMTFILLAVPGVVLTVIAAFSLREPRAATPTNLIDKGDRAPMPFREVLAVLWSNISFRHLLIAYALWMFAASAIAQWKAIYFIRSFGLKTGELGTWFALIYGIGGVVGTILGGEMAMRFGKENERRQMLMCAAIFFTLPLVMEVIFFAPNQYVALAALFMSVCLAGFTLGPFFATIQSLVPARMRAMSVSVVLLVGNLIGVGLGPIATGTLSDLLHTRYGEGSLRYAMAMVAPIFFLAAVMFVVASRTVQRDIQNEAGSD